MFVLYDIIYIYLSLSSFVDGQYVPKPFVYDLMVVAWSPLLRMLELWTPKLLHPTWTWQKVGDPNDDQKPTYKKYQHNGNPKMEVLDMIL